MQETAPNAPFLLL